MPDAPCESTHTGQACCTAIMMIVTATLNLNPAASMLRRFTLVLLVNSEAPGAVVSRAGPVLVTRPAGPGAGYLRWQEHRDAGVACASWYQTPRI